jgi:hypothetical protein
MQRFVLESWFLLLRFEWIMRSRGFNAIYRIVREQPVRPTSNRLVPQEDLCCAMDYACVFYFKRVLCLQRSAATTLLLRRHGWRVEMVIGAQLLPFRSHAWCEINGAVINDKPYMQDIYAVLERC